MPVPQIDELDIPPSRRDPTNFALRGDEFLGQLPTFAEQANALAVAVNEAVTSTAASESNANLSALASAASATAAATNQAVVAADRVLAEVAAITATQQAALAMASVANGAKPYATYAAALADLANIATNQIVDVVTDESRGGQRSLYQDNGTTLVYLRAVEMYTSPVSYISSQPLNDIITTLLVKAGMIPNDQPTLFTDLGNDAYFA